MPKNTVTDLIMSGSEASKIVMIQGKLMLISFWTALTSS